VSCCEHGNEPSGSLKGGELIDQLSDSESLKKDSAPWSQFVKFIFVPMLMEISGPVRVFFYFLFQIFY
jgi:hypothetical protein